MRKLFILSVLAVISTCAMAQQEFGDTSKRWMHRLLDIKEGSFTSNMLKKMDAQQYTPSYDADLGKVISDQTGKNPVDKVTVPRVAFAETYRSAGTKSPSSVRHTVIFDSRGTSHLITTVRL